MQSFRFKRTVSWTQAIPPFGIWWRCGEVFQRRMIWDRPCWARESEGAESWEPTVRPRPCEATSDRPGRLQGSSHPFV